MNEGYYRNEDCPNCGRHRVQANGVCEKCGWDIDKGEYAEDAQDGERDDQWAFWNMLEEGE